MSANTMRRSLLLIAGAAAIIALVLLWRTKGDGDEAPEKKPTASERTAAPERPALEDDDHSDHDHPTPKPHVRRGGEQEAAMGSKAYEEALRSGKIKEVVEEVKGVPNDDHVPVTEPRPRKPRTPGARKKLLVKLIGHLEDRIDRLKSEIDKGAKGRFTLEQKKSILKRLEARLAEHKGNLDSVEDEPSKPGR